MNQVNNFGIEYIGVTSIDGVKKFIDPSSEELRSRLITEQAAYLILGQDCPEIIPQLKEDVIDDNEGIALEYLTDIGEVDLDTMLAIITRLQDDVEGISLSLPFRYYHDYQLWGSYYSKVVREQGIFEGISAVEMNKFLRTQQNLLPSIRYFDTVFVHTDTQRKHFGYSIDPESGKRVAKIFDFDQAHFGNELEDFVWLSVRHPEYKNKILAHLTERLSNSPAKMENLGNAFAYFENYFLMKGMHDRVHRARGEVFDIVAKLYGRIALNSLFARRGLNLVASRLSLA